MCLARTEMWRAWWRSLVKSSIQSGADFQNSLMSLLCLKNGVFFELHRFVELQRVVGHTSEDASRQNYFVIQFKSGIML